MSTKPSNPPSALERDPVCGMNVNPATAKHIYGHGGKNYYFCCASCAEKFKADPSKYLTAPPARKAFGINYAGRRKASRALNSTERHSSPNSEPPRQIASRSAPAYVCPMCPEVRETKPGACPSCGMALEPDVPARLHAHRVHLPHASRDRAPRARFVPHLRHGPGAPHRHRRRRRKSRTARHDPALLGQPRAHRPAVADRHVPA